MRRTILTFVGVLVGAAVVSGCALSPTRWLQEPPLEPAPPADPVAALEAARAAGGHRDGQHAAHGHGNSMGHAHSAPATPAPSQAELDAVFGPAPTTPPRSVAFALHLASYARQEDAARGWPVMRAAAPSVFSDLQARLEMADIAGRGVFYRLKAGPVASLPEAQQRCQALSAAGLYCAVTDFTGAELGL